MYSTKTSAVVSIESPTPPISKSNISESIALKTISPTTSTALPMDNAKDVAVAQILASTSTSFAVQSTSTLLPKGGARTAPILTRRKSCIPVASQKTSKKGKIHIIIFQSKFLYVYVYILVLVEVLHLKREIAKISITVNEIAKVMNIETSLINSNKFPIKSHSELLEIEDQLLDTQFSNQVVSIHLIFASI